MNTEAPGVPADPAVAAEAKLTQLSVQIDALQAALVRLLQGVVDEEARTAAALRLVDANEQLALAALASKTEAEAAEQALQQSAETAALDALTRLPNRSTLLDRFGQAVAGARRQNQRVALLFLDLDNFKQYNDQRGHPFGDAVLCWVAERLSAAVRAVDTVSRHGGDEFLVLLADLNQTADAQTVAHKLIAALSQPVTLQGQEVRVTASVGIAIYPDDGADFNALVAHADTTMYAAKRRRDVVANTAAVELKQARLREANERLVLATLTAHDLLAAAALARERHAALMVAVAEELRNPSAPIRIAAAMLGRATPGDALLPKVQHIVEGQLTHMASLVSRLVEASQAEAGGLVLNRQLVDLGAVVDAAISAHQPVMNARDQHFESSRPSTPVLLHGDADRLEQIVSNLLDNACKHTLDGGHIRLSMTVDEHTVTLTVADDGIGITPEMLPYVFEPFVQDTHALGFNGLGLGIGLTVVRALVRAQGGDLVAQSAGTRRGSRFVVSLPLPRPEPDHGGADGHRAE